MRRPIAFAATAFAATIATSVLTVPQVLGWFAPVLLIKVLLAHLLRKTPQTAVLDNNEFGTRADQYPAVGAHGECTNGLRKCDVSGLDMVVRFQTCT
ncbi:hypothetical protein [Nocardia sp. NPDC057440]|uniref:hypothetical protein n=1 Tax=Nocardia sp. NPDC057440 TaxID=3346134 RepID=UPI00366D42B2